MPAKKATATATKKAAAEIIDFSNVKERGNFNPKHIEEGDYVAKITKVESTQAKDEENMWVFSIVLDEHPRATYPYYCKLVENQFWKVKALFDAVGIRVGQRKVKVDPNKLVGKKIGVAMEDDEYEGRLKSVVGEVFPAEDVTGPADDDVDPEDDDVEADDLEEDDIEEEPAPRKKAAAKKRRPEPEPEEDEEDEEEDDEEDDEEEEDEEPAPKKRAAKKAPAKKAPAKKAPARKRRPADDEEDEEDLEELDIDEL